jgi:alkanesulfonate monooxygenase SsuD/methylene tetrahydromethanopterin reductase-like flavin-dependent oxidoreductase (luciferase family)
MAATLDHACGGRLNLGLGAGWFEGEHRSLGFDFKTLPGRLQALEESCQIIKGMFSQEKTTLRGKHYNVIDAICNPKPVQKHLPLMIGGHGEKVLLKIVARHADMWNMGNADAAEMKRLIGVIERHGDTVGRNTDEIEKTLMLALCYKAPKQREETLSSVVAMIAQTTPELARERMIIGSKQECVDKIEGYIKAGVTHFIFMHNPPLTAEEDIQAFAEDIIPQFHSR